MKKDKKTILVVDDSPLIITRMMGILKELQTVDSADSSLSYAEAIESLTQKKIDIVFLDIQLGDKSGIDLLKFIKITYPEIIVIMLSNQASEHYRKLCKEEGSSFFIDKSKEFESIPQVLQSFI